MHFPSLLLIAAAAATGSLPTALAAPAPVADKLMTSASTPPWTIKSFKRTCNSGDTSCSYSYGIDTHLPPPTTCSYRVTGDPSKNNPASRASYSNIKCGVFTISSSWSGQFGAGDGFQTLAVTDGKEIAYPAYRDSQLVNGQVVSPDQSYQPQILP